MSIVQLDLFEETTEQDIIAYELKQLKEAQDKLRKGLFARHHDQGKMIIELMKRIDILESNACQK